MIPILSQNLFKLISKTLQFRVEEFIRGFVFKFLLTFLGKVGGWMDGATPDAEITDIEVEQAEDISKDKTVGPATPSTPMHPTGGLSHTKT